MPVYEYQCVNGHRFERVKAIKVSDKERDNDKCDKCNSAATLQISQTGAPILVGRGFHANDYGAPTKA